MKRLKSSLRIDDKVTSTKEAFVAAEQTYLEPSDAEAGYTGTVVTPTGHTPFKMRVVRVEFEHLRMRRVHESCGRTMHAVLAPTRAVIKFIALPGAELVTQGVTLPYQAILRDGQGHSYYDRTTDAVCWASISLPVAELIAAGIAIGGCDLAPQRDWSILQRTR
jgi:hypothetical protein